MERARAPAMIVLLIPGRRSDRGKVDRAPGAIFGMPGIPIVATLAAVGPAGAAAGRPASADSTRCSRYVWAAWQRTDQIWEKGACRKVHSGRRRAKAATRRRPTGGSRDAGGRRRQNGGGA